jgi:methionyl-tRNA formyltransferase
VTYAEKIEGEERRLDAARSAVELERIVRGLNPHIGTYLELDSGDRLGVVEARAESEGPAQSEVDAFGDALLLGTGEGALRIEVVKPAGKREMAAADFLRGNPSVRLAT